MDGRDHPPRPPGLMRARRSAMPIVLAALLAACSAVPTPRPGNASTAGPVTRVYIVERGDTLSQIAVGLGVNMHDLAAENGLVRPYVIHPGQRLRLPPDKHSRGPARSPAPAATRVPAPAPAPAPVMTSAPVVQPLVSSARDYSAPAVEWPSDGAVMLRFNAMTTAGKPNPGLDLSVHPGQRILSAAAGTVLFAGVEPSLGQVVVIDHGGGWVSAYAFAGQITVREGDPVKSRERIGVSGAANRMLHFELRRDNVPHDPLQYLPPRF